MNQKLAKRIRKAAIILAKNANPNAKFAEYSEDLGKRRVLFEYNKKDADGNDVMIDDVVQTERIYSTGTLSLKRDCIKGVYRDLKNEHRVAQQSI